MKHILFNSDDISMLITALKCNIKSADEFLENIYDCLEKNKSTNKDFKASSVVKMMQQAYLQRHPDGGIINV